MHARASHSLPGPYTVVVYLVNANLLVSIVPRPPTSTLFPYTTLFRSLVSDVETSNANLTYTIVTGPTKGSLSGTGSTRTYRSEEHTSELQTHSDIVCRLLLEKKNTGFPSATCDGPLSSDTKTVTITII